MLDRQRLRAFVLGGAVGALAGIIFAPKSGKEFRGFIASRAGEARERSRETYFEAQERMREHASSARERPMRQGETSTEGIAAEGLPRLGACAEPEPVLDPERPEETPVRTPPLRDVSWDAPLPASGEDPEELRRRIRETRSRLRAHLDAPENALPPGDRDV